MARPKTKAGGMASFVAAKKTDAAAPAASIPKKPAMSPPSTETRHVQVRLDADRFIRLREYALHERKTVQEIVVDLIDGLLDPRRSRS